jgi:hypothetical protein
VGTTDLRRLIKVRIARRHCEERSDEAIGWDMAEFGA